jgi:hypothetical protein
MRLRKSEAERPWRAELEEVVAGVVGVNPEMASGIIHLFKYLEVSDYFPAA